MPGSIKWLHSRMAILVSDTSVIIDLERGALLEDLFQLPFAFAYPTCCFIVSWPVRSATDLWRLGCGLKNSPRQS